MNVMRPRWILLAAESRNLQVPQGKAAFGDQRYSPTLTPWSR